MLQVMRLCGLAFLFLGFCLSGCVSAWYGLLQCCHQLPYSSRPPGRGRKREISLSSASVKTAVMFHVCSGESGLDPPDSHGCDLQFCCRCHSLPYILRWAATNWRVHGRPLSSPACWSAQTCACVVRSEPMWTWVAIVCVCMLVAFFALLLCASAF